MTFSIAARCTSTGMMGVAIASSSPAVAARCSHARAGAGVVATQNITDPALGPYILDSLAHGQGAAKALQAALQSTQFGAYRQLVVLGKTGPAALHSGTRALGLVGSATGAHSAAAGNLLAHSDVPAAMVAAFELSAGHLGVRLLHAMRAGAARGGEAGPIHSAGLLIVHQVSWPIVDLRVDWSDDDPLAALGAIWQRYEPQIDDYVRRAVDPAAAPTFGVAGNR